MNTNKNIVFPIVTAMIIFAILAGAALMWHYSGTIAPEEEALEEQPQTELTQQVEPQPAAVVKDDPPAPEIVPETKTPEITQQTEPDEASVAQPASRSGWLVYRNEKYNFQIEYPEGTKISDVSPSYWGGAQVRFFFPVKVPGYDYMAPGFTVFAEESVPKKVLNSAKNAFIDSSEKEPAQCPEIGVAPDNSKPGDFGSSIPTAFAANSLSFARVDMSLDYSAMSTTGAVVSYCAVHNGIRYRLLPEMHYERYTNGSDERLSLQHYDDLIKLLNFQFIN